MPWSDWQDGHDDTHDAAEIFTDPDGTGTRAVTGVDNANSWTNIVTARAPGAQAAMRAATPSPGPLLSTLSYKDTAPQSEADAQAAQEWHSYEVDTAPTTPPPGLEDLVEGVDWAPDPTFAPDGWEIESTDPCTFAWVGVELTSDYEINPSLHYFRYGAGATAPSSQDFTAHLDVYATDNVSPASGALFDLTGATLLDTADVTLTVTPYPGTGGGASGPPTLSLDLSGLTAEQITLLSQPRMLTSDEALFVDVPDSNLGSGGIFNAMILTLSSGLLFSLLPTYAKQEPRWRYWIPETTIGWHRIGGHLGNFGEGQRYIKTGGAWQPVLDGLAS